MLVEPVRVVPQVAVTHIGNWEFDSIPSNPRRAKMADTNAGGWNTRAGTMQATMDFVSEGYFKHGNNGHIALVLRADLAQVDTYVRGQGMVLGNVVGAVK